VTTSGSPEIKGMWTYMFTDMVGSTALRLRIGDAACDRLRVFHDQILTDAVTGCRGEIVKWAGDGIMAVYPTCSGAIDSAVRIQREIVAYTRRQDAVAHFEVRIGIAVGEATFAEGDYYGIAPIEAARLESAADPTSIFVADSVKRIGEHRSEFSFIEVGTRDLKGLAETMIHRVDADFEPPSAVPLPSALVGSDWLPLVGRAPEMEHLSQWWAHALRDDPHLVAVAGAPGCGRSRLVREFARVVHGEDAIVLHHCVVPGETEADIVRGLFAPASILGTEVNEVLESPLAGDPDEIEPFADSILGVLAYISTIRPVLVIIDDLHQAPESIVLLLRRILRESPAAAFLTLVTYREEAMARTPPVHDLLIALSSHRRGGRLSLDPLTKSSVAELVGHAQIGGTGHAPAATTSADSAGSPTPDVLSTFVTMVADLCAGNPFLTTEVLRTAASGEMKNLIPEAVPIPESVTRYAHHLAAPLSPAARELLFSAASLGASFTLLDLAGDGERTLDELLDLIEESEAVGLIREDGEAGRLSFVHRIVKLAL